MTNEQLLEKIRHIVEQHHYQPTVFGNDHVSLVAAYCMGVSAADPYANFYDDLKPWTAAFQVARVMGLFDNSPAGLALTLVLYTQQKTSQSFLERDNFYKGVTPLLSDYAARKLEQIKDGVDNQISRTYKIVLQIVQLAKILNCLCDSNSSMDIAGVYTQLEQAKFSMMPFCNNDVDAHPLAKTMLQTLIDEVSERI